MHRDSLRENDSLLETPLHFFTSAGLSTPAVLTQPSAPTSLGVILCHGFLSDKQSRTNRRLTELLVPQGIATFRFDWYGMGDTREHFAQMSLKQCEDQLESAFQVLHKRGINQLGLVGSSFGGLLAILSAAKYPDLLALGLKCPVVDFPESLRLEFGPEAMEHWKNTNHIPNIIDGGEPVSLQYDFYEECLTYDAYGTLSHIKAPTLIVHGEEDELIPRHQIDRLLTTLKSKKKLQLVEGAGHQFGQPEEFRLMTNTLSQWMVQHLKNS